MRQPYGEAVGSVVRLRCFDKGCGRVKCGGSTLGITEGEREKNRKNVFEVEREKGMRMITRQGCMYSASITVKDVLIIPEGERWTAP